MANPIVTALNEHIDEHKSELLLKSTIGGKTAKLLNLMTDVKGKTSLNLLDVDPVIADGSDCGFEAQGTVTASQRMIEPKALKVNMDFCIKKLLKTYANHQVKVAAGIKSNPWEEEFTTGVVNGIQEKLEKMIWNGDASNANEFDGLYTILATAVPSENKAANVSGAYNAIKKAYTLAPTAVSTKSDFVIFVGNDTFRDFVQELITLNLYHYDANDAEGEIVLPGTKVKVIGVEGLSGTKAVIGARLSNLVLGVSGDEDDEKFASWYSQDDDVNKLDVEWIMGTQVAYPNEVTLVTIA